MIKMYKIITSKQDSDITLTFNIIPAAITRVITPWNSLPDTLVKAESVNSFKGRLDRFWNDQEVKYNWKADIKGTGSKSNVL